MNKTRIFIILLFAYLIASHFKEKYPNNTHEQIEKFITNNYYGLDHEKDKYEIEKILKNNLNYSNYILDGYNTSNSLAQNRNY